MPELNLELLRKLYDGGYIVWSVHALERLQERGITKADVLNVLYNGRIIEQYPNAFPYPACLILGTCIKGKLLHVVCGSDGTAIKIITAYFPDNEKFDEKGETRKEK
ncbi:MAG: DUF4258 domain-containing protein [Eubacteriales bacterium]|nr:DUF4258 domain-containing protein [Eubacteriales bacterium]